MIRKSRLFALCAFLLLMLSGCGSKQTSGPMPAPGSAAEKSSAEPASQLLYQVSSLDYTLYTNIYYNDMASSYVGTKMETTGTFATIRDCFSDRTRYYVWGYLDETKCCDWQWELSLPEGVKLPENGSLIRVSGTFTADAAALDSYWLTDVNLSLVTPHAPSKADVDMSVMNGTLARVQLMNMQYYPEAFEGQSVTLYGRVETVNTLQHPYYDGAWSQPFETTGTVPSIGTMVVVGGTFVGGKITNAELAITTQYY